MILVTGATGKVGSEAARLLRQQGLPVRAMVRDPGKAAPLAAAGAELAEADFDDPGSIDRALAKIDTVIMVSPGVPAQELNVVAGAVRQGVKNLVNDPNFDGLARTLYNHGLVNPQSSGVATTQASLTAKPSYIDAQQFATALIDA